MAKAKKLKVIKCSPNNFSVLTITRALNELKHKEGFVPDVLIVDSPDLMRPSADLNVTGDNYSRVSKSMVYWELKALAIDHNYILFCTSQLTRDVAKKKDPLMAGAEDIADAYDKVRIADVMILLLETVELVLHNQVAVKIGKNRDGLKPVEPILLRADKSRMRFYDEDGGRDEFEIEKERNDTTNAMVKKLKPKRKKGGLRPVRRKRNAKRKKKAA